MSDAVLDIDLRDQIVVARINRAAKGNSLSSDLLTAIETLADDLSHPDGELRHAHAVVITSAGGRAFSAGANINELAELSQRDAIAHMLWGQEIFRKLEDTPQAVIAAIDGVAFGGGLELAMACDLRFASPGSRFGQPEITLANIPGWGGTQRLPRLIGEGRAFELMLIGDPITADRALDLGLINGIADEVDNHALTIATRIAAMNPTAIDGIKRAVYGGARHGSIHGLLVEARAVGACCETPQQQAAVQAFLNRKRS